VDHTSGIKLAVIQVDKKGRLVIPKEIREQLKIDESTPLIFEVDDENTIKIRIIRRDNQDYTSDPLWKAIHHPVILGKTLTSGELDEMEDEQWSN
jgi:AbrB family looped-hinge helix DNA binding protein